ncbi:MAG: M48 family peptidase, partial [Patescibacteria group bacterium]|nr:M48 family peptidase [Patescibacteria group bacterium]
VSGNIYFSFLIFVGVIGFATSILLLPIDFYSGYVLEHKYKLSNQTFVKWIWEELKGLIVAIAIGVPILLLFYYLILNNPDTWWLILA